MKGKSVDKTAERTADQSGRRSEKGAQKDTFARARQHGKPPFVPTEEQRRMVAGMASVRMSQQEMTNIIWNPHTNKPLGKKALIKHFRRELIEGADKLRALLGQRWLDLIYSKDDRVAWHAVEFGLKYICGYREGSPQVNVALQQKGVPGIDSTFKIEFVGVDNKRLLELDAEEIEDAAWTSRPRDERPAPKQIEHNTNKHDTMRRFDERPMPEGHRSAWDNGSKDRWLK
jgi:hypothetical protein